MPLRALRPAPLLALLALGTVACSSSNGTNAETSEAGSTGSDAEGSASGESGDESGGPGSSLPLPELAGEDTTVTAFDDAHIYWLGWDEGQNFRQIDASVSFPPAEQGYTGVRMNLRLDCPGAGCDWWDRKGFVGVVENAGREDERVIELGRFMTPYRVGGSWSLQLDGLRPLLTGEQTLRVYIDTWVGPGHANGDGWLVDVDFEFTGGLADEMAALVIPVLPEMGFDSGDPSMPIESLVPSVDFEVPAGVSRAELWTVISGHGQGNAQNCAEFCPKQHGFIVNSGQHATTIWRDDCASNPVSNQSGNWKPNRAGWCPGDVVQPWVLEVGGDLVEGNNQISYAMEDYENTCRPGLDTCTQCVLGTGCDYDGGNHTPPHYRLSSSLVLYGQR